MGIHQEANAWGGGIGLDEHPLDANPIGVIDWAIIDNILHAHTDWAGIYAAWRGGAVSGVSSGGTPFSVNAAYGTALAPSGPSSTAYNPGILTASNSEANDRLAGNELARVLLYVEINMVSKYYWTNYVFHGESCLQYAWDMAADIKALDLNYWLPEVWGRYIPIHYAVVLQPNFAGGSPIWVDAYTHFEFRVFRPSWNYFYDGRP
jgi:hypothetical protein